VEEDKLFTTFVIVGTVRNVGRTIKKEIEKFSLVFQSIGSVQFFLVESDSEDNTVQVLHSLTSNQNFDFISLGKLEESFPDRIQRLTVCRNEYLRHVYDNPRYGKSDFLVVADFDGINTKITSAAIRKSMTKFNNWDVLCANQSARYYDIYALRHHHLNPNDPFESLSFYKDIYKFSKAKQIAIYSRMIRIPKRTNPISVQSAFGGLAIYKFNTLRGVKYATNDDSDFPESEHISLHHKLTQRGYKIAIDPQLINSGWNHHNIMSFRFLRFLRYWLTRAGFRRLIIKLRNLIRD
jgi:hypothetical protein